MRIRLTLKQLHASVSLAALILISSLALTACSVLEVGIEHTATATAADIVAQASATPAATRMQPPAETQAPLSTATPTPAPALPTATPTAAATPTPAPAPRSPLWVEYRDPKYGYGMALPCFWSVFPSIGAPSVMSYDPAFHRAHSIRGHWLNNEWPERALKFDTVIFEGVDPALSLSEAVQQQLTGETAYVYAVEETTIGANPAVLAEMRHTDDASVSYQLPVFRLAPDKILFLSVSPRRALASSDMRRIIESLSLSPEQEIAVPAVSPEGPVEGREIYFDEAAGYCFAYPSTFERGEVRPGRPGLLGPAITEGSSTIRAGLTIETQDAPPERGLRQFVDAYQEQILDQAGSVIDRSDQHRLAGEPAEMIEYISGREGARDLLAVYGDRLYHARFTPSIQTSPRAGSDIEYLFEVVSSSFTFLPGDPPPDGPVEIYVVLPGDGGQSGPEVGCGDSVVAVESGRARTGSLAHDVYTALEELLSMETAAYGEQGYTHALADAGLSLQFVNVSGSGATVDVSLSGVPEPADECARARMEAQILHTVFQFPGVDSAAILLNGVALKPLFAPNGNWSKTNLYTRSEIQQGELWVP